MNHTPKSLAILIEYSRGLCTETVPGAIDCLDGRHLSFRRITAVNVHRKKPSTLTFLPTESDELQTIAITEIVGFSFSGAVLNQRLLPGPWSG